MTTTYRPEFYVQPATVAELTATVASPSKSL
jgi:hypothetical protein